MTTTEKADGTIPPQTPVSLTSDQFEILLERLTPKPLPLALNMTDAGKLCGQSRWKIQEFIRAGLPFIPQGRRTKLILVSALTKWLESRQITIGPGGRSPDRRARLRP